MFKKHSRPTNQELVQYGSRALNNSTSEFTWTIGTQNFTCAISFPTQRSHLLNLQTHTETHCQHTQQQQSYKMAAPIAIVQKPRTCFFTTEEEDNELINQWLEYYNLDYQVFYASFLNQAIKICQMAKQDPASLSMTDNALKWVLEVCISSP